MIKSDYHFVTHWFVRGDISDVYDLLLNALDYPRWWPSYLEVVEIQPLDQSGLNGKIKVVNRGWLPYMLTWYSSLLSSERPFGFKLSAMGELNGQGRWELKQQETGVAVTFYWDVSLGQSWIRFFSFFLRPVLISNHNSVMKLGETHLQEELDRRS
jgi:hypothetical protein